MLARSPLLVVLVIHNAVRGTELRGAAASCDVLEARVQERQALVADLAQVLRDPKALRIAHARPGGVIVPVLDSLPHLM